MRRSRSSARGAAMNLDPFLDVMTNVVGILVLIAVIVAVQARNIDVVLGRPVLQDPPTGAARHVVHCAGKRVSFLELPRLRDVAWKALAEESASREGRAFASGQEVREVFALRDVGTETHRIVYADEGVTDCRLRVSVGETSAVLNLEGLAFRQRLAAFDPEQDWLFFLVEESSFGACRSARELARKLGFDVGWYPHQDGARLSFTPDGEIGAKIQ